MKRLLVLLLSTPLLAQWQPPNPVKEVRREPDGMMVRLERGLMQIAVCSPAIVHVVYAPGSTIPEQKQFAVVRTKWPPARRTFTETAEEATVATADLRVTVTKKDGFVSFSAAAGGREKLIQEGPKIMTPAEVNGEKTYHAEDVFSIYGSQEAFYGLGQHQAGVWDYRGESVDLSQENTEIAIPLLVSSKGYGIFWNNPSRSRFNNRFVHTVYLSSEVADTIDYYFLYGPDFDRIVAGYRTLTGAAPMFGRWAYGYWQSKNRYQTQEELLGIAAKYRELKIPIDNIVQDWFWWRRTGDFQFNAKYPDPKGMIDMLHREHYHFMISIWPFFDPGSEVYAEMERRGYFIDKTKVAGFHPLGMAVYDATNPAARHFYWSLVDKALFRIGADAWWMDTTEPETEGQQENILLGHALAIGSGDRYANVYPLLDTQGVYRGQRAASEGKRVFILSRSAFAGSQRNGVTAWSGDVLSDWTAYRRQIPAGLNFSLSGIPYWATDIGGFFIGNPNDEGYRELFVRWFEYGTFCPIFRVHGTRTTNQNELWSYGERAQEILTKFDRLRYRLLPYIYSLAWRVTSGSYTIMRPLAMDFREDRRALETGDEFLFGPAILVSPVTEPGAATRYLYLPRAEWVDFWTGRREAGGRGIEAAAPLDRIPLYVRAGSIVPMGPEVQYAAENLNAPLELRVYPGADGEFPLYEDENDGYGYERGAYATVEIKWNDRAKRLSFGARHGRYPGMPETETFHVIYVRDGRGAGIERADEPDETVNYRGTAVSIP
jgi:alpha-D-xyloside xylohydrolase